MSGSRTKQNKRQYIFYIVSVSTLTACPFKFLKEICSGLPRDPPWRILRGGIIITSPDFVLTKSRILDSQSESGELFWTQHRSALKALNAGCSILQSALGGAKSALALYPEMMFSHHFSGLRSNISIVKGLTLDDWKPETRKLEDFPSL